MSYKILIINPGSTSTKIGVFEDETLLFEETLRHTTEELAGFNMIVDQKDFRKKVILDVLAEKNFDIKTLDVCVGRGGMLKPIPGGTYAVSDDLLEDLKIGKQGQHASNLGGILAREIGDELGVPSYIVDPVVVDELMPSSRLSGVPELPRISVFHALNQKAVAKRYAKEVGKKYTDLNLIVVHMGGGVSVGAHLHGRYRRCITMHWMVTVHFHRREQVEFHQVILLRCAFQENIHSRKLQRSLSVTADLMHISAAMMQEISRSSFRKVMSMQSLFRTHSISR